uniref:Cysteine and glycine-rich protein 1 n=1 Tax=Fundulus heteroclitus TaxID=8078 RepID=A0A146UB53_FUNHE
MPFEMTESEHCPRCDKPVFFAEEMNVAGKKWHKTCYKCGLCKRSLESTTLAVFESNIFCKHCYSRKYGPKGYGFGVGAGVLGMDSGEHLGNKETTMTTRAHEFVPGATVDAE